MPVNDNVLAMFYAPWCGACQQTKPIVNKTFGNNIKEYEEYMNSKETNGNKIIMVNVENNKELGEKFNVQYLPTFKILNGVSNRNTLDNSGVKDYEGDRNEEALKTAFNNMCGGMTGGGNKQQDPYYKLYKMYKMRYKQLKKK